MASATPLFDKETLKSELRHYLLTNLDRAIYELYTLCEYDADLAQTTSVLDALRVGVRDFEELSDRIQVLLSLSSHQQQLAAASSPGTSSPATEQPLSSAGSRSSAFVPNSAASKTADNRRTWAELARSSHTSSAAPSSSSEERRAGSNASHLPTASAATATRGGIAWDVRTKSRFCTTHKTAAQAMIKAILDRMGEGRDTPLPPPHAHARSGSGLSAPSPLTAPHAGTPLSPRAFASIGDVSLCHVDAPAHSTGEIETKETGEDNTGAVPAVTAGVVDASDKPLPALLRFETTTVPPGAKHTGWVKSTAAAQAGGSTSSIAPRQGASRHSPTRPQVATSTSTSRASSELSTPPRPARSPRPGLGLPSAASVKHGSTSTPSTTHSGSAGGQPPSAQVFDDRPAPVLLLLSQLESGNMLWGDIMLDADTFVGTLAAGGKKAVGAGGDTVPHTTAPTVATHTASIGGEGGMHPHTPPRQVYATSGTGTGAGAAAGVSGTGEGGIRGRGPLVPPNAWHTRSLHDKLSSPERAKPATDVSAQKSEHRHANAEANRERLVEQRKLRQSELAGRAKDLTERNAARHRDKEVSLIERLEAADQRHKDAVELKRARAGTELMKVQEIGFINTMTTETKKVEIQQKLSQANRRKGIHIAVIKERSEGHSTRVSESVTQRREREVHESAQRREAMTKKLTDSEARREELLRARTASACKSSAPFVTRTRVHSLSYAGALGSGTPLAPVAVSAKAAETRGGEGVAAPHVPTASSVTVAAGAGTTTVQKHMPTGTLTTIHNVSAPRSRAGTVEEANVVLAPQSSASLPAHARSPGLTSTPLSTALPVTVLPLPPASHATTVRERTRSLVTAPLAPPATGSSGGKHIPRGTSLAADAATALVPALPLTTTPARKGGAKATSSKPVAVPQSTAVSVATEPPATTAVAALAVVQQAPAKSSGIPALPQERKTPAPAPPLTAANPVATPPSAVAALPVPVPHATSTAASKAHKKRVRRLRGILSEAGEALRRATASHPDATTGEPSGSSSSSGAGHLAKAVGAAEREISAAQSRSSVGAGASSVGVGVAPEDVEDATAEVVLRPSAFKPTLLTALAAVVASLERGGEASGSTASRSGGGSRPAQKSRRGAASGSDVSESTPPPPPFTDPLAFALTYIACNVNPSPSSHLKVGGTSGDAGTSAATATEGSGSGTGLPLRRVLDDWVASGSVRPHAYSPTLAHILSESVGAGHKLCRLLAPLLSRDLLDTHPAVVTCAVRALALLASRERYRVDLLTLPYLHLLIDVCLHALKQATTSLADVSLVAAALSASLTAPLSSCTTGSLEEVPPTRLVLLTALWSTQLIWALLKQASEGAPSPTSLSSAPEAAPTSTSATTTASASTTTPLTPTATTAATTRGVMDALIAYLCACGGVQVMAAAGTTVRRLTGPSLLHGVPLVTSTLGVCDAMLRGTLAYIPGSAIRPVDTPLKDALRAMASGPSSFTPTYLESLVSGLRETDALDALGAILPLLNALCPAYPRRSSSKVAGHSSDRSTAGTGSGSSDMVLHMEGSNILAAIVHALRLCNDLASVDWHAFKEYAARSDTHLLFGHTVDELLGFAGDVEAGRVRPSDLSLVDVLVNELLVFVGLFALSNATNRDHLHWGTPPTLMHKLCALPFRYFSQPAYKAVLLPTLCVAICDSPANLAVLQSEISVELVAAFVRESSPGALTGLTSSSAACSLTESSGQLLHRVPSTSWAYLSTLRALV